MDHKQIKFADSIGKTIKHVSFSEGDVLVSFTDMTFAVLTSTETRRDDDMCSPTGVIGEGYFMPRCYTHAVMVDVFGHDDAMKIHEEHIVRRR